MDEVTYISIPGLVLLILRYYHHCFGCLRQQLFEINTSNLREYVESSLSSSVLGPVTEFHSMISSTGTFIFDKVDAEKAFWSISTIVESNLMPCASYSLMGFSLFCAYLVMRNVSSSYPEVPEVTDRRTTDNFTTYDFHGNGKSPAVHSRGDGPARGDFKSFVNVKVRLLARIILGKLLAKI